MPFPSFRERGLATYYNRRKICDMCSKSVVPKLSDAEWTVMEALWEKAPASGREVSDRTHPTTAWAYTTVKTLLSRLVEKGAVAEEKRGNQSFFSPLVTRKEARRSAVRALLDRAFGGTFGSLLQHMVEDERLSAKDRARLTAMLREEGISEP